MISFSKPTHQGARDFVKITFSQIVQRPLLLEDLNSPQRQAVQYLDGPLLVVAGAGSGKTGVITRKIAYLIEQAGYDARHLFAVTFTNKAAREMTERSKALLGTKAKGLHISTFHRLGLDMLHKEYARAGLRKGFSIFDARDAAGLVKELTKSEDDAVVRSVQSTISNFKNANLSPAQAQSLAQDDLTALAANAYGYYEERLRAYNAVDFDDLLLIPVKLLKTNADVREYWQTRIRYLLIDEYQDTNSCQYALLQLLTGTRCAFTAVGDDDQSIYAWRGAQPENLANLHSDYPALKTIKLEQNYRCHQNILKAANELISHNSHIVEKRLWSHLDIGEGIHVISAKNDENEAEKIVSDILTRQIRFQTPAKNFAILYRSNFQSRALEQKLREYNIPYKITGGNGFYEYAEIRDMLSYLRLISNPEDDAAFLRVCNTPKREIGPTTLTKLGAYAARRQQPLSIAAREVALANELTPKAYEALSQFTDWLSAIQREADSLPPTETLNRVLQDIDYEGYLYDLHKEPRKVEKRLQRIGQLKAWIGKLQEDERYANLDGLMQHLMLLDILGRQDKEEDAVQLMTLHSAKGLEFPIVYIVGVEEGLLPHANSSEDEAGIAEERRLLYVGMTRAKETLTLSYAKKRRKGGEWQSCDPSRFFDELPEKGIQWHDGRYEVDKEAEKKQAAEMFSALKSMLNS